MSLFSFSSSADITDIFKAAFPDCAIAQKMKFGPNKLSYLICFGIAPCLKQQLLVEPKETMFSISFDKSFNNGFHNEQMDFLVKYFNNDRIVCRYLTSRSIGHTCENLKKEFEEGTQELDMKKMVIVSMDGPSVNWKLYDSIMEERNQNDDYPALIDIGSCSHHAVHRTFRSGVQKTKWGIDGLLKAKHNLLDTSPAKFKKFVSEMKQFHSEKFAGFKFGEDRLDAFFYHVLNTQKT